MELQRHGMESVEREVRWLSDLINAERHDEETARTAIGPPADPTSGTTTSPEHDQLNQHEEVTSPHTQAGAKPAKVRGDSRWVRSE